MSCFVMTCPASTVNQILKEAHQLKFREASFSPVVWHSPMQGMPNEELLAAQDPKRLFGLGMTLFASGVNPGLLHTAIMFVCWYEIVIVFSPSALLHNAYSRSLYFSLSYGWLYLLCFIILG